MVKLIFSASPLAPEAEPELCRPLLETLDQIHLVTISPTTRFVTGRDFGAALDSALTWATEQNEAGANVYWTVNAVRAGCHAKPKKADIVAARFAHVDIDPPQSGGWNPDAVVDELASLAASPSFVLNSGNGLQAFWRLEEPAENWSHLETINLGIRHRFGADACQNIDRLMRLPGFINWPDEKKAARGRVPVLATVAIPDDGTVYAVEALASAFPATSTAEPSLAEPTPTVAELGPVAALMTCDDLGLGPMDPIRSAIEHPPGRDRSGDLVAAARLLANAGHDDRTILGLLLNPNNAVSAHAHEQRDPRRAIARAIELVRTTPSSFGAAPGGGAADLEAIETLDWAALASVEPSPKRFVIPKLAPAGEVTLFTGPGSAGKSLLGQQIATALAAGVATLRLSMGQAPAIYLTCEDDAEQLHWRQAHICRALGVPMPELAGKLWTASLRGRLDNALGTIGADGSFTLSPAYHRLAALIHRTGARLVVLDNLSHLFTGNENDRGDVTRFANALNRLAGETGAAIVLLGHTNKAFLQGNRQGNAHSGSTAWLNAVRSQFTLEHDTDTDIRTLTVGKANYARNGEAFRFAWVDWAFVHEKDLTPDTVKAMAETIMASADNRLFLACLSERLKQRRAVSEKNTSSTYAPKVFALMPESKGIGRARLEQAMERLFRTDEIERAELWRGDDRKPVFGLQATPPDCPKAAAGDLINEEIASA